MAVHYTIRAGRDASRRRSGLPASRRRSRLPALLLVAALAAGAASAQQAPAPAPRTVARLVDLQGTVLVSQEDAWVAGVRDQKVPAGARIVTLGDAKVTVSFDKGCDVRLEENHRFTVREQGECAARVASVENLLPAPGAIGGGAGGSVAGGAAIGEVALAGILVGTGAGVYETLKKDKTSRSPK